MSRQDTSDNERVRQLMMAALDDEASADERAELERRMAEDPAVRDEWNRLRRVKEVTTEMSFRKPPEEVWGRYWGSVYNRIERGIGWVLVSVGAIVLAGYGAWHFVDSLLADTEMPVFLKLAIFAVVIGGIVLLVSVVREKLFTRKHDPYKEVER